MKASTIEKWTWVLIYGGLLTLGLGLSVRSRDDNVGTAMLAVGAGVATLGVVCVFVRSFMKNKE